MPTRSQFKLALLVFIVLPSITIAGQGTLTIPFVTGRPGTQPFKGHPGWVDAYPAGNGKGVFARIDDNASFNLPDAPKNKPICLIAMFDKIETPPVIVPGYVNKDGQTVLIPTEYACAPEGYPDVWDKQYMHRAHDFYQTIKANCTQLYGVSVFDGPKFVDWGNKINVSVHKDRPDGELIMVTEAGEGASEHVSASHSDHELPRIGWRHGDMPLEPGKTYYIEVIPTKPIMMYADGDYYKNGYAYYERLKADRASGAGPYTFHSERWTLAMNIVTYANKGGGPLTASPSTVSNR